MPSIRVSTRQTPSCSSHSAPSRRGTSSGVARPFAARWRVTTSMSRLTSAGKIGFTRCSTSGAPARERTYQVALMRPDGGALERRGREVERVEHGSVRERAAGFARHRAHMIAGRARADARAGTLRG